MFCEFGRHNEVGKQDVINDEVMLSLAFFCLLLTYGRGH